MVNILADTTSDAVSLTGIIGLVIAVITGIVVPIYMYRKGQQKIKEQEEKYNAMMVAKDAKQEGSNTTTSWDLLTKRLERERDRLAEQLEASDERFGQKLAAAEEKWRRASESDRARITELEAEVGALQRVIEEQARRLSGAK